jgi:hypothetical protein
MQVKADPKLESVSGDQSVEQTIAAVEEVLGVCQTLADRLTSIGDLDEKRTSYRALRDSARELAADTRATVGDITSSKNRVSQLFREADDGAKR